MSYLLTILKSKNNAWNMTTSNSALIGSEIRRKRLSLSITLYGMCSEICSPSYLCKIERNQIAANQVILHEIFEKISFSKEQEDMLFHFYEYLEKSAHYYAVGEYSKIEDMIHLAEGFDNYRYDMLKMMASLSRNERYYARELYEKLIPLVESMQDADLMIFTVFSAILFYYEKNYRECHNVLSEISDLPMSSDLTHLRNKYLFLSSGMLGSYETDYYYRLTTAHLTDIGYYSSLEEVNYAMAVFSLKTKSYAILKKLVSLLHEDVHKNTINYYLCYLNHDFTGLNDLKDKELNEYCRYVSALLEDDSKVKEKIYALTDLDDDYDFSSYLLKYKLCETETEKRRFIMNTLRNHKSILDFYTVRYFLTELTYLNIEKGHYRDTVHAYSEYMGEL